MTFESFFEIKASIFWLCIEALFYLNISSDFYISVKLWFKI